MSDVGKFENLEEMRLTIIKSSFFVLILSLLVYSEKNFLYFSVNIFVNSLYMLFFPYLLVIFYRNEDIKIDFFIIITLYTSYMVMYDVYSFIVLLLLFVLMYFFLKDKVGDLSFSIGAHPISFLKDNKQIIDFKIIATFAIVYSVTEVIRFYF